jgi:putative serine/threonine protein kinase
LSQTQSERIRIDEFVRTPFLNVLTYPRLDLEAAGSRVRQLEKLGVEEVLFEGRTKIGRLGLVGIGTVSVVVRGVVGGRIHALKIRRMDANRESMMEEYRLTQIANRIGVGAQALAATEDFMLMQLVEGRDLEEHLRSMSGVGTRARAREVLHLLLNQCRKLDLIDLDHGQLSDLRKHVIMAGDAPYIIDFESSSQKRTPKNVTTAAQYALIGGRCAPFVKRLLGIRSHGPILGALKEYKRDRSDGNYASLLRTVGIVI